VVNVPCDPRPVPLTPGAVTCVKTVMIRMADRNVFGDAAGSNVPTCKRESPDDRTVLPPQMAGPNRPEPERVIGTLPSAITSWQTPGNRLTQALDQ
jgi:hypothetical protein